MTNSDFKLLNNYLGSDAYAYIIIRSNKALNPLEERLSLYKKIKRKFLLGGVIYSNVNYMSSNCIALHNIAEVIISITYFITSITFFFFFCLNFSSSNSYLFSSTYMILSLIPSHILRWNG